MGFNYLTLNCAETALCQKRTLTTVLVVKARLRMKDKTVTFHMLKTDSQVNRKILLS